jgi:hypothetical protein
MGSHPIVQNWGKMSEVETVEVVLRRAQSNKRLCWEEMKCAICGNVFGVWVRYAKAGTGHRNHIYYCLHCAEFMASEGN